MTETLLEKSVLNSNLYNLCYLLSGLVGEEGLELHAGDDDARHVALLGGALRHLGRQVLLVARPAQPRRRADRVALQIARLG